MEKVYKIDLWWKYQSCAKYFFHDPNSKKSVWSDDTQQQYLLADRKIIVSVNFFS